MDTFLNRCVFISLRFQINPLWVAYLNVEKLKKMKSCQTSLAGSSSVWGLTCEDFHEVIQLIVLWEITKHKCSVKGDIEMGHYGPRANENLPLFSYLSDSKNQTIIDKVLLANDRGN